MVTLSVCVATRFSHTWFTTITSSWCHRCFFPSWHQPTVNWEWRCITKYSHPWTECWDSFLPHLIHICWCHMCLFPSCRGIRGNEDALPNIPTHIILWEYYHFQISHPWSDYICQIFHPRSEILLNIPTKITNNTKYSHSRSEHTPGSHTNETPRSALPNPVTCIPLFRSTN